MPTTTTRHPATVGFDTGSDAALDAVAGLQRARVAADLTFHLGVLGWVEQHTTTEPAAAAVWHEARHYETSTAAGLERPTTWTEHDLALAGDGTPHVAEFALYDLAAAIGLSADSARRLVARLLELHHRLPRLFTRWSTGQVATWRAFKVADHTMALPPEVAASVDRQVAPIAHRIGPVALERLVAEAHARFDPQAAEAARLAAAETRGVSVRFGDLLGDLTDLDGTTRIEAVLDTGDARDLDLALNQLATQLGALGCPETHQVRRALALGEMARATMTLDLTTQDPVLAPGQAGSPLTIYLTHGDTSDTTDTIARIEETHTSITTSTLTDWVTRSPHVTIKVVGDLEQCTEAPGYTIPERLHEQVRLRDPHCVFPHCPRAAKACDTDHIDPYPHGTTCPCNLAPLCRRHHRAKTHGRFTYQRLPNGTYHWHTPTRRTYLVDHDTTHDTTCDHPPPD